MTSAYIGELDLTICKTSIEAQKINGNAFKTYDMDLARFLFKDSWKKVWFFKETFLLANTGMEVILRMLFLLLSNTDIKFVEKPGNSM